MNIIPFVTVFIFTISFIIFSTLQSHQGTKATSIGLDGYFALYREAKNATEQHLFDVRNVGEDNVPKPRAAVKRKGKTYSTSRVNTESASSKLNVALLFDEKNQDKEKERFVKEALAQLINGLYGNAPFFKTCKRDNAVTALIGELIESQKSIKEIKGLEDLVPKEEDLKHLWYKMLKGASLSPDEGFPPISNYVIIVPTEKQKAISFKGASIPVLEAFLGKETTQEILKEEEKKYFNDTKKCSHLVESEYKSLLKGENSKKVSLIKPAYWSRHKDRVIAYDKITKIAVDLPAPPPKNPKT